MNNVSIGKYGEDLACKYLSDNGYKIIERNLRFSRFCEIDILAFDKNTLVFCEVKTRSSLICGLPQEAITKSKYQNIKKGVFFYLNEHSQYKKFRIDAISITLKPELKIEHLKNI
ncbi:MAG: YraN family protein [bacterium]|nr:YraN family protein [bacterium]